MIGILITLLVVLIIAAVVFYILGMLPIPQPWLNICRAVLGLIILIWLLAWLLPGLHAPLLR